MPKFFIEKHQIVDGVATLDGENVNHLAKVLRAKPGDEIILCDGEGTDFDARLLTVSRESVTAEIINTYPARTEPKVQVTLYQGLPKQGKMEWIIEKCTEMGISCIVPVEMERSVVKLSGDQGDKKQARWAKTAEAAAKQCGRGRIPEVLPPVKLSSLKQEDLPEFLLLPYENENSRTVRQVLTENRATTVGIFIGPEGGFADSEVAFLESLGAKSVTLGPRILRTETAGLAALTVLLYEWDEMNG